MQKSENNLIDWIANAASARRIDAPGEVGIGDDMAVLTLGDETLLIAADMLMDGVHFDVRRHAPAEIGRKAIAVNLSDCAAMAARPWCALVSVVLPAEWSMAQARELFGGLIALADEFDCRLVGGDTNSWNQPLAIDVTILARPFIGIAPVLRRGAQVGDGVFVTGTLGGSLAEHHMTFRPRVAEARQLATALGEHLHAMMDLSDGLSTDATRLAKASDVGIEFDRAALLRVASEAAKRFAANDDSIISRVVNDGEDFELLFCADGEVEAIGDLAVTRIGRVVGDRGVWLCDENARREPLDAAGWQHFQ